MNWLTALVIVFAISSMVALILTVLFLRDLRRDRQQAIKEYEEELKHWGEDD